MSRHRRMVRMDRDDQNPSAGVEHTPSHRLGLVACGPGAGVLQCLDGGDRGPAQVVATAGADRTTTAARVVPRGQGYAGRSAADPRSSGLRCPPAAVDHHPVVEDSTGPAPRGHHVGHPFHGVGDLRGFSRRYYPRGLDHPAGQHHPCLAPCAVADAVPAATRHSPPPAVCHVHALGRNLSSGRDRDLGGAARS